MSITVSDGQRSQEQIRDHYLIEKELADKLRAASRDERSYLYSDLYNELYRRVPLHPQLTRKKSKAESDEVVESQLKLLRRFLGADVSFLEVGPGDCALSIAVCSLVKQAYAVDVSEEITSNVEQPDNFKLIISDGTSIPVGADSIDLVYSNQLMEHLHPDDAREQLENIYACLKDSGAYLCITPNKINGPHDVSFGFDQTATGFHLKEYTTAEIVKLFKSVGFRKVRVYVGLSDRYFALPDALVSSVEAALSLLPHGVRYKIASRFPLKKLVGMRYLGLK